jgi:glycerol uptake facilitator-like aquaporin
VDRLKGSITNTALYHLVKHFFIDASYAFLLLLVLYFYRYNPLLDNDSDRKDDDMQDMAVTAIGIYHVAISIFLPM